MVGHPKGSSGTWLGVCLRHLEEGRHGAGTQISDQEEAASWHSELVKSVRFQECRRRPETGTKRCSSRFKVLPLAPSWTHPNKKQLPKGEVETWFPSQSRAYGVGLEWEQQLNNQHSHHEVHDVVSSPFNSLFLSLASTVSDEDSFRPTTYSLILIYFKAFHYFQFLLNT